MASQSAASNSATTAQNLEVASASFDTTDGTLTLTKANSGIVTTDLDGRYAELTGATFTGDVLFNDGVKAKFGDSDDLLIYHDSSPSGRSVIEDAGTGGLDLITNGTYIRLLSDDGDYMFYAAKNSGVYLFHDNYIKLETTIDGIRVRDDAQFDTNINVDGNIAVSGTVDGVDVAGLSTTVAGKADLSGATFTGDITAKSKLIVNKQPVASDLLTTSRSIQDLAAWSVYVATAANYALTPEKYRDSLDVNQDNRFSAADSYAILVFVTNNYTPNELSTCQSLLSNPSNITSTFVQDVLDGDYDSLSTSAGVTVDRDASSIVTVDGHVSVDGNIIVTGDISAVDDFGADSASFTGDVSLLDNGKIKLGDDDNLQIYHNPTNNTSYIENAGGSDLTIQTDGLYLKSADNTKAMLNASQSGAVNLFHSGAIALETRADGVRVTGDIAVSGTVDGVDVATLGANAIVDGDFTSNGFMKRDGAGAYSVDTNTYLTASDITGKADLSGADFTGDVSVDGDITVTGTVDGVDVGNLKYHNVDYFMLRDGYTQNLSTSMVDIGTYTNIYDTATPMPTMRLLDLNASINWLDTIYNDETYQNDVEIRLQLVVPTGTTNAVSLGSVTQISGGGHTVGSSFQKWYYVSGDVTHHFSDFGKMHENSSGGSNERTLYGYQYNPSQNRTYFSMSTYPTAYASGTTVYWHPYQWESAGTVLTDFRYAREKGRSGSENVSLMFKTAYDDRALTYRIKIRELSASSTQPDRAQITQTMLKITKQEP